MNSYLNPTVKAMVTGNGEGANALGTPGTPLPSASHTKEADRCNEWDVPEMMVCAFQGIL